MNNRKNVLPPAEEPAAGTVLTSQGNGVFQAVKEKYSQNNRDISSKTVFGNAVLCAQFLRDNLNIPVLRDVQPEDIEDVSERCYPYHQKQPETCSGCFGDSHGKPVL